MSRELLRGCSNLCYTFPVVTICVIFSPALSRAEQLVLTLKSTLKAGEVNCCSGSAWLMTTASPPCNVSPGLELIHVLVASEKEYKIPLTCLP